MGCVESKPSGDQMPSQEKVKLSKEMCVVTMSHTAG